MKKYNYLVLVIVLLLSLQACGKRSNPTGGKVDIEKPTVLMVSPSPYSGIGKGTEIVFQMSKSIDPTTVTTGLYIYPPISHKRVNVDGNAIQIRILEALQPDTNYFISLTTRVKDERNNPLATDYTVTFASGKLQDYKISGNIQLEKEEDVKYPIQFTVMTGDSLLIYTTQLTGNTYAFENLNPGKHLLRSYIDKDKNGRYDFGKEPYWEAQIGNQKMATTDIYLAYADTSRAVIRSAAAISSREWKVQLSEVVKGFESIDIQRINDEKTMPVAATILKGQEVVLLTTPTDTTRYLISISQLEDLKGNVTPKTSIITKGVDTIDKTAPKVISTNPRSGTMVKTLNPRLEVTFSEPILAKDLHFEMIEVDYKKKIPVSVVRANDYTCTFMAKQKLNNYSTYLLRILKDTQDASGNTLGNDIEISILPIVNQ